MPEQSINQATPRDFFTIRSAALAVTLVTGCTGLVYEVTWHRYLANLLGSQARAAALILAVFLGGLCLGYSLFGKLSRNKSPSAAVAMCAWIEIVIGVWALLFPQLYQLVWSNIGVLSPAGGATLVFDTLLATALIGLPTICMGGTLPLLTQGLSADLEDASPFHALVYSINTGGAFLGCLLAGFFLLPAYGLGTTMYIAGLFNLAAGGILYLLSVRLPLQPVATLPNQPLDNISSSRHLSYRRASVIAFLAGFYSLTLQVVFMRTVALAAGASEYSFSMVVAVFILMLSIGAWRIAGHRGKPVAVWVNQLIVACGALAVYLSVPYWPYSCHILRTLFSDVGPAFYLYHIALFLLLCLVLAIPVGAMGGTMPLLFSSVRTRFNDLGSDVGRLYGWNTFGCVVGAIVGGYLLLYFFQLHEVYRLCLAAIFISVVISVPWQQSAGRTKSQVWKGAAALAILVLSIAAVALPDWKPEWMASGLFRTRTPMDSSYDGPTAAYAENNNSKLLVHEDGPNTTASIYERPLPGKSKSKYSPGISFRRSLSVNGKSDGSTEGDMATMRMAAHLPMLLSERRVENAAVIGFGLGVTIGELTLYPEVEKVNCIEISPVIQKHSYLFDFANYGVSTNQKVRWSVDDAYRVLGGSEEKYSLIVSEPSNPWVSGVERLFASEFYAVVRSRLKPQGIYTQWVQLYEISEETLAMVLATFGKSFPFVRLFKVKNDLFMLGSDQPIGANSLDHLATRYYNLPAVRKSLAQVDIPSPESLLAHELWIPVEQFFDEPIHSLEHPKLSFSAGRDFFSVADPSLNSWMRRRNAEAWQRRAGTRTLFGSWLLRSSNMRESLKEYAKAACGLKTLKFLPNWKHSQRNCRDALVALKVLAISPLEGGPSDDEVELLRWLVQIPGAEQPQDFENMLEGLDAEGAAVIVKRFAKYDSPLLPLSVDRLILASSKCTLDQGTPARLCQFGTVEALARSGYSTAARVLFNALDKQFRSTSLNDTLNELESVVTSSEQAAKMLPDQSLTIAVP